MTVAELIALLTQLPSDALVLVWGEHGHPNPVASLTRQADAQAFGRAPGEAWLIAD